MRCGAKWIRLSSRQLKPLQEPENDADISFLVFFFGWQRGEANDIRKQRHHQRKVDPLNFKLFRKGNMRDEGDFATRLIWEASDSDFS